MLQYESRTALSFGLAARNGVGIGNGIGENIGENVAWNATQKKIVTLMRKNPKISAATLAEEVEKFINLISL